MKCPICGEKLKRMARLDVELDLCPTCKGVWLDRGELEQLIDLVLQLAPAEARAAAPQEPAAALQDAPASFPGALNPVEDDDDDWQAHQEDHFYYGGGEYFGHYGARHSWFKRLFDVSEEA